MSYTHFQWIRQAVGWKFLWQHTKLGNPLSVCLHAIAQTAFTQVDFLATFYVWLPA